MTLYKSDGSLIFRLQFRNHLLWTRSTQVCLTKYLPTPSPRTARWLPPHPGLGGVSWSRDQEREVTAAAWRGEHIKSPTLLCLEQSHPALGVGGNPLQEGTYFDGQYIRQLNPDKVRTSFITFIMIMCFHHYCKETSSTYIVLITLTFYVLFYYAFYLSLWGQHSFDIFSMLFTLLYLIIIIQLYVFLYLYWYYIYFYSN